MKPSNLSGKTQVYKKYYLDREYEQLDLYRLLKRTYPILRVLYPGSFVHVSPSFIFSDVTYIDSDKEALRFFENDSLPDYVRERKEYKDDPKIVFHGSDYRQPIDALHNQFDLLISQYAGFISDTCKEYLKIGGHLLVNNSHADAGLAYLDADYKLVAAVHKAKGRYRLSAASLEEYFIPKKDVVVTRELLFKRGKGVGYTKAAPLYIFQRRS